jgi:hypothetical protein
MTDMSKIKEHMEVIGADGTHVGTVDRVENNRIKLVKSESGEGKHKGHHHFIDASLIAEVEGTKVRLSANADVAVTMEAGSVSTVFSALNSFQGARLTTERDEFPASTVASAHQVHIFGIARRV